MSQGKPSKNMRCPCGSGKKYGKCCTERQPTLLLPKKLASAQAVEQLCRPRLPPSVLRKVQQAIEHERLIANVSKNFRERQESVRGFVEQYGHARPPLAVKFNDKMTFAIGSCIYSQSGESDYTFLNAIHDHALNLFGLPMLEAEEKKPFDERHPALQWMYAFVAHHNKIRFDGNIDPHASQIGAGAAWYRFAYDLYTIQDNAKLEAILKKRLLNPDSFQGARHELWVAALSVGAGFVLEFEDESDNSKTHPEFIGIDKSSKVRIAVEAKSRRRKGAYGFAGGKDIVPGLIVDVRQLILDAYTKKTEFPFYIFIDVNLPGADKQIYSGWLTEIEKTMADLEKEGYATPCPANVVFFVNDPSHYLRDEQIGNQSDSLWIKPFRAAQSNTAHPEPDILDRFMKSWRQRAVPPKDFPKFD